MSAFCRGFYGLVLVRVVLTSIACDARAQSTAPAVAGVTLGMSAQNVRSALGPPELEQQSLGMRFWEYRTRGITLIWRDDSPGVHGVVLTKRDAAVLRGVRVGDSRRDISANWGPPVRVRRSGRFVDFAGIGWTLSAEIEEGRTIEITLLAAR